MREIGACHNHGLLIHIFPELRGSHGIVMPAKLAHHEGHQIEFTQHHLQKRQLHLKGVLGHFGMRRALKQRLPGKGIAYFPINPHLPQGRFIGFNTRYRHAVHTGVMRRSHENDALYRQALQGLVAAGRSAAGKLNAGMG